MRRPSHSPPPYPRDLHVEARTNRFDEPPAKRQRTGAVSSRLTPAPIRSDLKQRTAASGSDDGSHGTAAAGSGELPQCTASSSPPQQTRSRRSLKRRAYRERRAIALKSGLIALLAAAVGAAAAEGSHKERYDIEVE
eukprot:TRINITY_DN47950_c0_g1_i1.p1 TRINITY_DN47950_c0_g1~~TRINITY_DN47950_c0_g1_i1.p1  ORF type:complete len:137 (+),score=19.87 TRINITY_DN47950_c0_g1_i1:48-458(+)